MIKMLVDAKFPDVYVRSGEMSFPAHRTVLASRSPVLAAMLEGGMREALSHEIILDDMEPAVLWQFLLYLYGRACEEGALESMADHLFVAASKYQVPDLMAKCVRAIACAVTLEKVAGILVIAHLHDTAELFDVCFEFVRSNPTFVESADWVLLQKDHPDIATRMMARALG